MTIDADKFNELLNSPFYKNGQIRTTFSGEVVPTFNAAFDTMPVPAWPPTEFVWKGRNSRATGLYSNTKDGLNVVGENNPINLQHLHKVLTIDGDYIPVEFRDELCRQWNEVNSVINAIKVDEDARVVASEIFIVSPGTDIGKHRHLYAKQTLTFGYRFSDRADDSVLLLWDSGAEKRHLLPLDNKFYFTFRDHADHAARINSWMFFWFFDFDQHISIPGDIPFTKTNTEG